MKPMVSVIVPVYNAEQTIRRCVASILDQQFTDLELLLVDDGSTDGSGAICDEFAARDARVTAIHQKNAGVSAARNHALDLAQGVYLQFLDSDDWITPDATRSLVRAAEAHRCDLVIADFYRVVGERLSRKGDIDEDSLLTREEYAAHMMENPADFYYGVLWNKLYRTALLRDNGVLCREELNWSEDFLFNLEYIRYAHRFCAVDTPVYYYVKNEKSITHTQIDLVGVVKTKAKLFTYYKGLYESLGLYEKFKPQIYKYLVATAEHP